MAILVGEYKTIFLRKRGKRWISLKILKTLKTSYRLVLKTVKSLNQIFLVTEYWFKAL